MKTLVVYYSRTGNTRRVALHIADALDADMEQIEDAKNRDGIMGFLKGGKDSLFRHQTELGELTQDPGDYDLVVVGTPVWAGTVCPAIRTWLARFRDKLNHMAFFLTTRTSGKEKTFTEMAEISGTSPHVTLPLTVSELKSGEWISRSEQFTDDIKDWQSQQTE